MAVLSRVSARTEKTVRLVLACAVASVFGITAVVIESETWGYIAISIMLAGILIGPVTSRLLTEDRADD
jgi:hypothetical protein